MNGLDFFDAPEEGDIKIVNGIVYQFDFFDVDEYHEELRWLVLCPACDFKALYPGLA